MFDIKKNLETHYEAILSAIMDEAVAAQTYGEELRRLQRGLTGDRSLAGEAYMSGDTFLTTYLLYYWPVSYLQVCGALTEVAGLSGLPKIRSILDIGAGPGAAACACRDFGAENATLLDSSAEALSRAESICANNANMAKSAPDFIVSKKVCNLEDSEALPDGQFDLIVACHSINELWKNKENRVGLRAEFLLKAFDSLAPGGLLLVVEPSALVTSRPTLELRDILLETLADSAMCTGPCPASFPCPILAAGEQRTCHSTWQWKPPAAVAELASAAGLDRDSVKATWFALKKLSADMSQSMTRMETPGTIEASNSNKNHMEEIQGRIEGRIVSEPMLNKAGRVRYVLCTGKGLSTVSARAGDAHAEKEGFFALKRGDHVAFSGLDDRPGATGSGFGSEASLRFLLKAPRYDELDGNCQHVGERHERT
jgi:ribosomal protein RSM22 (predicted rRNA methylase)